MSSPLKSYLEYVTSKGRKYYYETSTHVTSYKFPADGVIFDPNTGQVIYHPPGVTLIVHQRHQNAPATSEVPPKSIHEIKSVPTLPIFKEFAPHNQNDAPNEWPSPLIPPPNDQTTSQVPDTQSIPDTHATNDDPGFFEQLERETFGNHMRRRSEAGAIYAGQVTESIDTPHIHRHTRKGTMPPCSSNISKAQRAASAPIARAFARDQILMLPFALPLTFTKRKAIDALNKYKLEDFATTQFRKHKKKGIAKGKFVPLEELMSYQSTSLQKPLLRSVPSESKKLGAKVFKKVLKYTGAKHGKDPMKSLISILQLVRDNYDFLCDELYFQLVKQTTNNMNRQVLLKTWELFLIIATIFPSSDDCYMWILAHIGRFVIDPDSSVSAFAALTFLRFQTRHLLDMSLGSYDRNFLARIPEDVTKGSACFSCTLYEMMWNQKSLYPNLPIPYVLYYIIKQLQDRNARGTNGIFRVIGNKGITADIFSEVNKNMVAISRGDVNVIANLLRLWLKELPDPVVPVEMSDDFVRAAKQNKFRCFIEKLPQVHKMTLLYIIGFLQDIYNNAHENKIEKSEIATIFGPCLVNPSRVARDNVEEIQHLTELSIAFVTRLIDEADPSPIYPLNPLYLSHQPQLPSPSTDGLGRHLSMPLVQADDTSSPMSPIVPELPETEYNTELFV